MWQLQDYETFLSVPLGLLHWEWMVFPVLTQSDREKTVIILKGHKFTENPTKKSLIIHWSNSFHETTVWFLPPGSIYIYILFTNIHPTKKAQWHQCCYIFELRAWGGIYKDYKGSMLGQQISNVPPRYYPILHMAQCSQKKWWFSIYLRVLHASRNHGKPWKSMENHDQLRFPRPASKTATAESAPKKRVHHIEARIQSRHLDIRQLKCHEAGIPINNGV